MPLTAFMRSSNLPASRRCIIPAHGFHASHRVGVPPSVILVERYRASASGISSTAVANWRTVNAWILIGHHLGSAAIITTCCILTVIYLWKCTCTSRRHRTARHPAVPQPPRPTVVVSATAALLITTVLYWIGNGPEFFWHYLYIGSSQPACWFALPVAYIWELQPKTDVFRHGDAALSFAIYGGVTIWRLVCGSSEPVHLHCERRNVARVKTSSGRRARTREAVTFSAVSQL
ncbi:uncharacterized protein LOC129589490 [Paramacrobiotus metropolitanus]|uniref:uncharacterized protein LOC129589490 n=1 Tax=Paramacrobiotus metropolitanus TaxID=2943436 RepID=UPI0024460081|nr:uncharacterized protein LOC129589490 [Paramacrobiotus metropolitanus]